MTVWQHVLTYELPDDPVVTTARVIVVWLAAVCIYFAVNGGRWKVDRDRRLIYGLIGLLCAVQEVNQLAVSSPFLVWRLPLILLLELACLTSMRRYVREGGRRRE